MKPKTSSHLSVEEKDRFKTAIMIWANTGNTDFECEVCQSILTFEKFAPPYEDSGGWLKCACGKYTETLRGL